MDVREQGLRRIRAVTAGIVAISATGATVFGLLAHGHSSASAASSSVQPSSTGTSSGTTSTDLGSTDQDPQVRTGGS